MNSNHQTSDEAEDLFPSRLRQAREGANFTRASLAKAADIPQKTIERFETGTSEPSFKRMNVLAETLSVDRAWLSGESDGYETKAGFADVGDDQTSSVEVPSNDDVPASAIRDMLETLDDMRVDRFAGMQRRAMVLVERAEAALHELEPDQLIALGMERGLYADDCPAVSDVIEIFGNDPEQGQSLCGDVEARILDTAILGADLYDIEERPLRKVANRLAKEERDVNDDTWWGWEAHDEFVPIIRSALRRRAFGGSDPIFDDREVFPRRS